MYTQTLASFLLLLAAVQGAVVGRDDVVVKDLHFFVDGEEFWIKSVCYQPTPLGRQDMAGDQTGGTGLCSERQTPFGEPSNPQPEFKSACYDSDYFCGLQIPQREPPGPEEGWFNGLWERDFPVMKELGINTVRLYNTNPTTYQASREQLGTGDIAYPLGKDHLPFMDRAEAAGLKVIFPLIGDKTLMLNTPREEFQRLLMNQIDEVGNHSALLMYTLGNELGLITSADSEGWDDGLIRLVNSYIAFSRQYQIFKWGRFIPITIAEVDYPDIYTKMIVELDVDVFTSNAGYRGAGFSNLWSGDGGNFPGFLNLSCSYDIPLFIGEWGWESINNEQNLIQPDWFNEKYADLVRHEGEGCVGGSFFEFNDEIQKASVAEQTMGIVALAESPCSREENCWEPDLLVEKENIFDAVKSGVWDGEPYNYNGDFFTLVGRSPMKLSDSTRPSLCEPFTRKSRDPIFPTDFSTDVTFTTESATRTGEVPGTLPPSSSSSLTPFVGLLGLLVVNLLL